MRTRLALALTAVSFAAAGSLAPADAAGVIKGTWTAEAFPPEPSQGGHCAPLIPQARDTFKWTVPGPGRLQFQLNNKLDWSADLRDMNDDVLAESDGGTPELAEGIEHKFTKKTTIVMGACNLGGEPSVTVTYTFTPAKKR